MPAVKIAVFLAVMLTILAPNTGSAAPRLCRQVLGARTGVSRERMFEAWRFVLLSPQEQSVQLSKVPERDFGRFFGDLLSTLTMNPENRRDWGHNFGDTLGIRDWQATNAQQRFRTALAEPDNFITRDPRKLKIRRALLKLSSRKHFRNVDFNSTLDVLFGSRFWEAEEKIQGPAKSHLGTAQWSESSPGWGVQTDYGIFVSLFSQLRLGPGSKFVDIGSSYGRSGLVIGELLPKTQYVGYEIVRERAEFAEKTARANGFDNVRFRTEDVSHPQFKLEPADYYFLFDSLNAETMAVTLDRLVEIGKTKPDLMILMRGRLASYEVIAFDSRFVEVAAPEAKLGQAAAQAMVYFKLRNP